MMTAGDLKELGEHDYPGYLRAQRRELAELDRQLEAKDRLEREAADPHRRAIVDLAALGVPDAEAAWIDAVIATRVWLLEIGSGGVHVPPSAAGYGSEGGWKITRDSYLPTPYDEWLLWQYVAQCALLVVAGRRKRNFGTSSVTPADVEEARLRLQIENERWLRVRRRAAWVLRGFEEAVPPRGPAEYDVYYCGCRGWD